MDFSGEYGELRPATLLDDFIKTYAYDRTVSTSDHHSAMCYLRVGKWTGSEWEYRWRLGGIASTPDEALLGAFGEGVTIMREDYKAELGDNTSRIVSIVLVSHGTGRFAVETLEGSKSWSELTPEQQAELRELAAEVDDEDSLEAAQEGEIPVRVLNIITPRGLGAEIALFRNGHDKPQIERAEQYISGEGDDPKPQGMVDEALMSSFMFLTIIYDTVKNGHAMTTEGLLDNAIQNANREGGREMMAFLLKMVASGIENNILGFGED
jgi:hypothetical protein